MAGHNLTAKQRAAEAEAEMRNSLLLQPVVVAQDSVGNAIRDFVHVERQKSFAFLGQHSHANSDEQVFGIEIGHLANIEGVCRRRQYDLSKHLEGTIDVRCYTFRAKIFDVAKIMPLRSASAQRTVPATTGRCKSELVSEAPGWIQVQAQEDDAVANSEKVTSSEGSSSHVPIEDIQVLDWLDDGEWMDVREWMRKDFNYDSDAYDWKFPQRQLEEQAIWWRMNGLSFRLLDLPGELRNLVYIHIIGAVIVPTVKADDDYRSQTQSGLIRKEPRLTFGVGHHYPQQRGQARHDPDVDWPNLAILRLCKQVHDEAIGAVWNGSAKRFRDNDFPKRWKVPERFPFLQYAKLVPALSSTQYALNNIQLELSATRFFLLIGIAPTQANPWKTTTSTLQIDILKSIPSLTKLDFRFMSPKHADARCPWSSGAPGKHSCQKLWIDYFLTHTFPHLRRSGSLNRAASGSDSALRITMSGCVKTSTRIRWEEIFADERRGLADYNNRRRIEEIKCIHARFEPIPCHCRMPCVSASDPWSKFDSDDRRLIVGLEDEISETYWSFGD